MAVVNCTFFCSPLWNTCGKFQPSRSARSKSGKKEKARLNINIHRKIIENVASYRLSRLHDNVRFSIVKRWFRWLILGNETCDHKPRRQVLIRKKCWRTTSLSVQPLCVNFSDGQYELNYRHSAKANPFRIN